MWNINLKPSDRLHEWKTFRGQISDLALPKAIERTNHLWSYAPFVNYYLSPARDPEWPDPWTLLHENYYCDVAKGLGILYTLLLSKHYQNTITQLELRIYQDPKTREPYNTVWVNDGEFILNLTFDTVEDKIQIDKDLVLKYCYSVQDLKLQLD
jgi:hypothetical protein